MSSGPKTVEAGQEPPAKESAVIYHCRTGSFLSPVAAAIHLGCLPAAGAIPSPERIKQVIYFGQLGRADRGFLHFCGRDRHNREVFVMGDGGRAVVIKRAIVSAAELAGLDPKTYSFIDCSIARDWFCGVGEWIWRNLAGKGRGGVFLSWQVARVYRRIVELVRDLAADFPA